MTATPCRMQLHEWRPLNKKRPREFKTISPEALKLINCRTSAHRNSFQSVL